MLLGSPVIPPLTSLRTSGLAVLLDALPLSADLIRKLGPGHPAPAVSPQHRASPRSTWGRPFLPRCPPCSVPRGSGLREGGAEWGASGSSQVVVTLCCHSYQPAPPAAGPVKGGSEQTGHLVLDRPRAVGVVAEGMQREGQPGCVLLLPLEHPPRSPFRRGARPHEHLRPTQDSPHSGERCGQGPAQGSSHSARRQTSECRSLTGLRTVIDVWNEE